MMMMMMTMTMTMMIASVEQRPGWTEQAETSFDSSILEILTC